MVCIHFMVCDIALAIYTLATFLALGLVIIGLSNYHLQNGIQLHPGDTGSSTNYTGSGASSSYISDT